MKSVKYAVVVCACALSGSLANGAVFLNTGGVIQSFAWAGSGSPSTVGSAINSLPTSGTNTATAGTATATSNYTLTDAPGLTQFNATFSTDAGGQSGGTAASQGFIFFTVTEQVDYEITGLFNYAPLGAGNVSGQSVVMLRTTSFATFYNDTQSHFGGSHTTTLAGATLTGTLAPGQYRFEWNINGGHSFGNARTTVNGNIGLSLTAAVPTPGAVALFGLAGGAITRRRRR